MKFIVLQSNYTDIEIGIKLKENLEIKKISKFNATPQLIPTINDLLIKNKLKLKDLDFISVNQGPAPFTTLRVILSTINGFSLATHIPLVGVDGLKAFLSELENKHQNKNILILLNAFGGDIYFGLKNDNEKSFGYQNLNNFLNDNKNLNNLVIAGNAIEKFSEDIKSNFKNSTIDKSDYVKLETIAKVAEEKFKNKDIKNNLQPLYLKSTSIYKTK